MRPIIVALWLGVTACATSGPLLPRNPELADVLMADSSTTTLTLVLDLDAYLAGELTRAPAELRAGPLTAGLEVERIGDSSAVLCRWRKLRLRFGEEPKKRLYLTPHCNDDETRAEGALPGEEQLYGQALAYRLLAVLDVPSLAARLVHLRWVDRARPERALARPAILVEDIADVARVLVGDPGGFQGPGREGPLRSLRSFDEAEVARFHLFQILINNRDWRAFELEPLGRRVIGHHASPLHNVFALDPATGRPVIIPLDLDASSLAAVPRTVADSTGGSDEVLLERLATPAFLPAEPPLVRWMVLRLQGFRQSHSGPVADAAIASFVARRPALEATIAEFEALMPEPLRAAMRARAAAHLDAFFRATSGALWALPFVADAHAPLYAGPAGDTKACPGGLARGLPLILHETQAGRVHVSLAVRLAVDGPQPRPLCPGGALEGWLDASAISAHGPTP